MARFGGNDTIFGGVPAIDSMARPDHGRRDVSHHAANGCLDWSRTLRRLVDGFR